MTPVQAGLASAIALAAALAGCASTPPPSSGLAALARVSTVDERFLSYNIEMVELTGGRFWRPYASQGTDRYEYRPPLDLADPKLRKLAAGLAPAYVRYSGTWANATWFSDTEDAPAKVADGFDTVLTRKQWRGAVDFARATGGAIMTSFATSAGVRDAGGVWQSDHAARWLAYTRAIDGHISASEFGNEPNMISLLKPPPGYTADAYRRDYARFVQWLRKASPETLLLAPGTAELGEPARSMSRRNTDFSLADGDEFLHADSPRPDAFSFHFYGGASERCGGLIMGHTIDKALTAPWLDGIDAAIARVAVMRDRVAPGAPIWDTESGETACGGNRWAAQFADSFRFIDTLGRSARQGVKVFAHNTLAASDYALLDEHTYNPRPNYWAALLWKRSMGSTVLAAPTSPAPEMRIYAHCLPGRKGGVGLAIVNTGNAELGVPVGGAARAWVMQAPALDSKAVTINGRQPTIDERTGFAGLEAASISGGLTVPARSIAFVAADRANNPACR